MRVLINGLVTGGVKTGIGHYASELIRCLENLAPGPERLSVYRCDFPLLRRFWSWWRGCHELSPRPATVPTRRAVHARLAGLAREVGRRYWSFEMGRLARRDGAQLYHEPNFLPLDCDLPTVVTVHDLSALLHPEWHPADRVDIFRRRFLDGLSRAVHLLAISEAGRQEIIRTLNVPPERVSRTYMGIRPGLVPQPEDAVRARLEALGLPPRYLLHVGTLEPRKNVLMLLRAYCSLPDEVRQRWPLLLVGGWGWNVAEVRSYFHDTARHRGVLHAGYVRDEELATVYSGARALLFPSHYEGFGLPPIEMMACGGAVIGSTAPSVVETVGRKAHLLDPSDGDGWREAMLRVCREDDWHEQLCAGVEEVARPFTWEQCARDTVTAYRRVLSGGCATPVRRAA